MKLLGFVPETITDFDRSNMLADQAKHARLCGTFDHPEDAAAPKDQYGWPTDKSGTYLFTDQKNVVSGDYVLRVKGKFTDILGAMNEAYNPNDNTTSAIVRVTPGLKQLILKFPAAMSGLTVMKPGYHPGNEFTNTFVNGLKQGKLVRCMMLQRVNNDVSTINWADRPLDTDATYSWRGLPTKLIFDLATQTGCIPWMHVKVGATDDYLRGLGNYAASFGKEIWVEFGNEMWNGQFKQFKKHQELCELEIQEGDRRGLAFDGMKDIHYLMWRRSAAEVARIKSFMPANVKMVLAGQLAESNVIEQGLKYLNHRFQGTAAKIVYAIAGAPYWSIPRAMANQPNLTVNRIMDAFEQQTLIGTWGGTLKLIDQKKRFGIAMAGAYEGGRDLFQYPQSLAAKIESCYSPRHEALTQRHVKSFFAAGADFYCHFMATSAFGVHGYWGATDDGQKWDTPVMRGLVSATSN